LSQALGCIPDVSSPLKSVGFERNFSILKAAPEAILDEIGCGAERAVEVEELDDMTKTSRRSDGKSAQKNT
jgi:hypothetical protein